MAVVKLRVLGMFLIRRLAQGGGKRSALRTLRSLRESAQRKDVLVIASGPSASQLNVTEVSRRQKAGDLVVIATNYFLSSPLASTITPDFLVWSDEIFHPNSRPQNEKSWSALQRTPGVTVVSPWTWKRLLQETEWADRFVYFDDDTLEGWTKNVSPLHPRGYAGSTGAKALALATHLGGKKIHIIGVDLSYFQGFTVNEENRVFTHPRHVKGADSGTQEFTQYALNGLADLLYSQATQFLALHTHFASFPVVNLDPNSLVDAFPKEHPHPLTAAETATAKNSKTENTTAKKSNTRRTST